MPDVPAGPPDVTVLSTGHDLADARLHRIADGLVRAGLRVEVVGLGDPSRGPAGTRARSLGRRPAPAGRLRTALTLPLLGRTARVVLVLDPDLVPTALLRRLVGRRAVVVDMSEDYLPLLRDRSWATGLAGLGARAVAASADGLARYADLTVVADEHVPPARARRRRVVRGAMTSSR